MNQITNTGSVIFTSSPSAIDFYRSYNNASGFICWVAPANVNGISNAYQWLDATQTGYFQDFTQCTFMTKINNYVGQITKSAYYKFEFSGNAQDSNLNPSFWISSAPTSGYTLLMSSSSENGGSPATWVLTNLVFINAGTYLMINAQNGVATTMTRVNSVIQRLESSTNVVNSIATNTYTNPATRSNAWIRVADPVQSGAIILDFYPNNNGNYNAYFLSMCNITPTIEGSTGEPGNLFTVNHLLAPSNPSENLYIQANALCTV